MVTSTDSNAGSSVRNAIAVLGILIKNIKQDSYSVVIKNILV